MKIAYIGCVRPTADDYGVFHSLDLLVIKKKKNLCKKFTTFFLEIWLSLT